MTTEQKTVLFRDMCNKLTPTELISIQEVLEFAVSTVYPVINDTDTVYAVYYNETGTFVETLSYVSLQHISQTTTAYDGSTLDLGLVVIHTANNLLFLCYDFPVFNSETHIANLFNLWCNLPTI